MRRKKLANKIVSILMAGLMVASTPMSALATDVELTDGIQQIEAQSASEDGEAAVEEDSLTDETAEEAEEEELAEDEEITVDEDVTSDELAEFSDESGEEVILGEEETDEIATQLEVQDGETAVENNSYIDYIKINKIKAVKMENDESQYNYTVPATDTKLKNFII